jgi:hypothetical protein
MKATSSTSVRRRIPCQGEDDFPYTVVERVTVTRKRIEGEPRRAEECPKWSLSTGEGVNQVDEDTYRIVWSDRL